MIINYKAKAKTASNGHKIFIHHLRLLKKLPLMQLVSRASVIDYL